MRQNFAWMRQEFMECRERREGESEKWKAEGEVSERSKRHDNDTRSTLNRKEDEWRCHTKHVTCYTSPVYAICAQRALAITADPFLSPTRATLSSHAVLTDAFATMTLTLTQHHAPFPVISPNALLPFVLPD